MRVGKEMHTEHLCDEGASFNVTRVGEKSDKRMGFGQIRGPDGRQVWKRNKHSLFPAEEHQAVFDGQIRRTNETSRHLGGVTRAYA